MRGKIRKYFDQFVSSCRKSKKQAAVNIASAVMAAAAGIAAGAFILYGTVQLLKVLAVLVVAATVCIPDFWERIWAKITRRETQVVEYPVYFGYDRWRIVPHLVDGIFKELYQLFAVCYYFGADDTGNRLVYHFKCVLKPETSIDLEFLMLVQKVAESILSRQFSEYGASPALCGDMVAVDISGDRLMLSFAKTRAGLMETVRLQDYVRHKYMGQPEPVGRQEEMEEQW